MSNPYYSYSGNFIPGTLGRAEQVAAEFEAVQAGFALLVTQGVDTGAASAYVVTTQGAPTGAYTDGSTVQFKAANANTGAATINVNGIGVVALLRSSGVASVAGDILMGTWYTAVYDSTYGGYIVVAPSAYTTSGTVTISGSPPTYKVGLIAAAGSSTAVVPIDAKYAIDQSIAPTWIGAHVFSSTVQITGGLEIGTPTGGNKGANTLNVAIASMYLDGTVFQAIAPTWTSAHVFSAGSGTSIISYAAAGGNPALTINGASTGADGRATITFVAPLTTSQRWDLGIDTSGGTSKAFSLRNNTNGGTPISFAAATNAVTIATPIASATALTINSFDTVASIIAGVISGGTHNPRLIVTSTDSTATTDIDFTAGSGAQGTISQGGNVVITLPGSGRCTIGPPVSGIALTVNGVAAQYVAEFAAPAANAGAYQRTVYIQGATATGKSGGLFIQAGTNSSDDAIYIRSASGSTNFMEIYGDGHGYLGYNGSGQTIAFAATGAVTITATGAANDYALTIVPSSTNAESYGLFIGAGTTSADSAITVQNYAQSETFFNINGDGSGSLGPSLTTGFAWSTTETGVAAPSTTATLTSGFYQVGYLDTPQNSQAGAYQLVMGDRGGHVYLTSTGHTLTIPANGTVGFPIGTTITIVNNGGGNNTIGITTDTLYWCPSLTTGSRTIAAGGIATILKITSTKWFLTGVGIS